MEKTSQEAELWEALQQQQFYRVEDVLCHGVKVNCKLSDNHVTPLHYCAQVGDVKLFKLLLSKGANVRKRDRWMDTVLHYACKYDQQDIVEMILSNKEQLRLLNCKGKNKYTPVMHVIENTNVVLFKYIISKVRGCKFENELIANTIQNIISLTSGKIQRNFLEVVGEINKLSVIKEISKYESLQNENPEINSLMQNFITSFFQNDKESCLKNVAANGDLFLVKMLLESSSVGYSMSCLVESVCAALRGKHFEIADMLIDNGVDVEYSVEHFILCVKKGNLHLLKKMISLTRGFRFWSEESQQQVMYAAVEKGDEELVQVLGDTLGKNFVQTCDKALQMALAKRSLSMFKYFKDMGVKLSDETEIQASEKHPMVLAVETGNIEFVMHLLHDKVLPFNTKQFIDVIRAVVSQQQEEMLDLLLPVLPKDVFKTDVSVCVAAINTKNIGFFKFLMRKGLELNSEFTEEMHVEDQSIKSPLHAAVKTELYDMVFMLPSRCCNYQKGLRA